MLLRLSKSFNHKEYDTAVATTGNILMLHHVLSFGRRNDRLRPLVVLTTVLTRGTVRAMKYFILKSEFTPKNVCALNYSKKNRIKRVVIIIYYVQYGTVLDMGRFRAPE